MVRQRIIKPLSNGALVRSNRGNTYEAIFKSKVMTMPDWATHAEVEFENKTPVITSFHNGIEEPEESLEEQAKAFKELGGDY